MGCWKKFLKITAEVRFKELCHHDIMSMIGPDEDEFPFRCVECNDEIVVGDFEVTITSADDIILIFFICKDCIIDALGRNIEFKTIYED